MTRKDWIAVAVLAAIMIVGFKIQPTQADTGSEGAQRIERGSYSQTRLISVSSDTGTALFSASVKRADGMCFNNSASIVWVGTTSATAAYGTKHENIRIGFPIASSATFRLDGSFTGGDLYVTLDNNTSGPVEVRCIDGLVR